MRTVASLGLESSTHKRYIESLEVAARSEIAQGPYTGFVLGLTLASFMLLQVTGFLYSGFEVGLSSTPLPLSRSALLYARFSSISDLSPTCPTHTT